MSALMVIDAKSISAATYGVDVEAVKKTVETYSLMTVNGIDDKKGLKSVREARLELRKVRTAIESRRKELKADSIEYGKRVDSVAKELTAIVEPTEELLEQREKAVENEIARLAAERIQKRMNALRDVQEFGVSESLVNIMSDEDFELLLDRKTAEHSERVQAQKLAEEEAAKKAAEEAAAKAAEEARLASEKKAEEERLAAERQKLEAEQAAFRAEQEAARKKQEEQQAAIDAENDRLAAERRKIEEAAAEQQRQAEAESKRIADAEQARKDAEAKAERERIMAEEAAAAEIAEAARREALKPDREKLLKFADKVAALKAPELSAECAGVFGAIKADIAALANSIRSLAEKL